MNSRQSKLNREQILAIRNSTDSVQELAKKYNVTTMTIYYTRNRKIWKNITEIVDTPQREVYKPKLKVDNKPIPSTPFHP